MIDLGLGRISRLLQASSATAGAPAWRAIHVAGTNGKGSVCAYLSAMLYARGLPSGRFTSPHLVDRWDCVVVDERPVSEGVFRAAEQAVQRRDQAQRIGATEFELLTATAFEVFGGAAAAAARSTSPGLTAVVECGLGGAQDATTAMLAPRAVTVITAIGLDHQGLLGATLPAIAANKAGIMRAGVPCVVDAANQADAGVRAVLEDHARTVGVPLVYPDAGALGGVAGLEPHQRANLACAYAAFRIATGEDSNSNTNVDIPFLTSIVQQVRWPGRLQTLDVGPLLPGKVSQPALLDGAHNPQSADVLGSYVDKHLRPTAAGQQKGSVTWILAASHGKDLDGILQPLLRPGDRVAAVAFGPVDEMPWVRPAATQTILAEAGEHGVAPADQHDAGGDLLAALQWATGGPAGGPLVIAGSLYLVSDTLRLLRQAGGDTWLP